MSQSFTSEAFTADVLSSPLPVLVDFSAAWCGPCRMLAPVVDRLAKDLSGTHVVGTVDVDQHPDLAERYGVVGVPTLILFKGGEPVGRTSGFIPSPQLRQFVLQHS